MKKILLSLGVSVLLSASLFADIMLFDGTSTDGWSVYTDTPGKITTHDGVLSLSGEGRATGYRFNINGIDADTLSKLKVLSWNMKYSEDFTVYIAIRTEKGARYLIYTPRSDDRGLSGNYIRIGLGGIREWWLSGRWSRVTRDIGHDLRQFEPDNKILSINSFLIRGTGEIDNIALLERYPLAIAVMSENAEDGNTDGWSIYSGDTNSASIENIYDPTHGNRVIKLQGDGKATGFKFEAPRNILYLGGADALFCWDMKSSEDYTVYLELTTPDGKKYITYTPKDEDRGVHGDYIHLGLGTDSMDGQWHKYCADPFRTLHRYFQHIGYGQLSVDNFLIRGGSVSVDNLHSVPEG